MEIRHLTAGKSAPEDADRVTINTLPSGKAGFSGVVLTGSVSANFVHANDFDTPEDAEREAIAIAAARGATLLYVEHPES